MRLRYGRRREALLAALSGALPDWRPSKATGGLHVLVALPNNLDEPTLLATAARHGVGIEGLSLHSYTGECAPGLVLDGPAFVTHRVCCNGVFWSVSWYEPRTNMSYTIDLSRSVAARYGSQSADDDVAAARSVGALAAQLVRLP